MGQYNFEHLNDIADNLAIWLTLTHGIEILALEGSLPQKTQALAAFLAFCIRFPRGVEVDSTLKHTKLMGRKNLRLPSYESKMVYQHTHQVLKPQFLRSRT